MRSVRLNKELEARLVEAARVSGRPVSGIIRDAVAEWCDTLLGQRLDERLADVIGIVRSDGGRAEKSGTDGALLGRARDLMERYRDTPMDLADATLVALAEARQFRRIFSLDSDFLVYPAG